MVERGVCPLPEISLREISTLPQGEGGIVTGRVGLSFQFLIDFGDEAIGAGALCACG